MVALDELIKHRAPMRLIDTVVTADDISAHCQTTLSKANLFFREQLNGIPAHAGIELMAQTVAAVAGSRHRQANEAIKIGFLLGSRKYHCQRDAFLCDVCYDIYAEEIHAESSGLSVFNCRIEDQGEVIAEARLNVYQPPDEATFIKENYE
ncbi:hotdog family protein [Pseudidiomarina sp. E22-M8]|uniref:hotdog family protein n=1 Tax=Pseudidiomarina sp. E22-M8 TaxID=3424768 RepID=UPI00403C8029